MSFYDILLGHFVMHLYLYKNYKILKQQKKKLKPNTQNLGIKATKFRPKGPIMALNSTFRANFENSKCIRITQTYKN